MSEERLMILKMIQDGKITPEQGESLLKALPGESGNNAKTQPPLPPSSAPHPSSIVDLQGRLADVQVKLGELQSKLGAATSSAPASAPAVGKGASLPFGLGDLNVGQMIDEAVRGVTGLKSESVKTFKMAARAAQKEGRRIRREAKRTGKNLGIDLSLAFADSGRPRNTALELERTAGEEIPLQLADGRALNVTNRLGDVKILSSTGTTPYLKFKRTTWSMDSEKLNNLDLVRPNITLDDSGRVEEIVVDSDAGSYENIALDIELVVPDSVIVNVETTFGNVACEGRSAGVGTIESQTGDIKLLSIRGDSSSEHMVSSRSGSISISHWDGPSVSAETVSGSIKSDGIAGKSVSVRTRSGEVMLAGLQLSHDLVVESSSGDIRLSGSNIGQTCSAKSQSGDVFLSKLRVSRARLETVSGDLSVDDINSVDGAIMLETVSGDILSTGIMGSELSTVTISGGIELSLNTPFSGALSARTISGDIDLKISTDSNASIEVTTQTGSIHSSVPLESPTVNGNRYLSGSLGAGQGKVILQTVSGDVTFKPLVP
jgi:DUF4097 and DUF4098 domain-containing protein YvlB